MQRLGVINLGINRQHLLLEKTKTIKFGDFGLSAEVKYLKEISFAKRKVREIITLQCTLVHLYGPDFINRFVSKTAENELCLSWKKTHEVFIDDVTFAIAQNSF